MFWKIDRLTEVAAQGGWSLVMCDIFKKLRRHELLYHFFFEVHIWNNWRRLNTYLENEREIRLQTYFKFLCVRKPLCKPAFYLQKQVFLKGGPDDFQPGGDRIRLTLRNL